MLEQMIKHKNNKGNIRIKTEYSYQETVNIQKNNNNKIIK